MAITQPRGQQGRQYDQEQLEARLRDALADLMADGATFRELSVARIIDAAGVARSTFYSHYDDKGAMVLSLATQSLRRLYRAHRDWLRMGAGATHADIKAAMRELVDGVSCDEAVLRAVTEAAAYDPRVRSTYVEGVNDYARAMAKMIRVGQRAGRIRQMDPERTAEALAWMCERTVSLGTPGASLARREAIAEALADIVVRTLFTEASRSD